jgi:hypothetical protein
VATTFVVSALPALASAKLTPTVSSGSMAPLGALQLSATTDEPKPITAGVPEPPQQA